jgi:hippurate hydrolase
MRSILASRFALVPALLSASLLRAQSPALSAEVDAVYPRAESLYIDLHRRPELSFHETETAARIARELRQLGYDVTTGVGRTGIVAVMRNGAGPTVMLRTELDALPVVENTGLAFASTVRTKDDAGSEVGVMHACGHDLHMAALVASARIMAGSKASWHGTLVLIGQPAEETLSGAKAMIADGLLTRFPRPDYVLAVHDDARYEAGIVGYRAGPILSNSDALIVHIYGRGGHGARPETTIDPVVIAARTVLALQTIVSREVSPFDAAVVTVGMIHGGTKNNIIPDDVTLQLTVRSFTDPVRRQLLAAIERIV